MQAVTAAAKAAAETVGMAEEMAAMAVMVAEPRSTDLLSTSIR